VWWAATARGDRFARIAVTPVGVPTAASLGEWMLVGIGGDSAKTCTALAVGGGVANGTITGASWLAKNAEGGPMPSISFAVSLSENAVVPTDEPLPECPLGPAATNPLTTRVVAAPAAAAVPSPPPIQVNPQPTPGGEDVYPLELNWKLASASARELLAAPSNPDDAASVVVFGAMRDGATSAVWWVAAARGGTGFTRVAVIPVPNQTGRWLLLRVDDTVAGANAWTWLAVCDGVQGSRTPRGAWWRAFNQSVGLAIDFDLRDRTSDGAVAPTQESLPGSLYGWTYGDAGTNPFTRNAS
jgi:hypothetical protein